MRIADTNLLRLPSFDHLKLARRLLVLLPANSQEIKQYRHHNTVILTKLTPDKVLTGTFPSTLEGTPYAHFCKTEKIEDIVVFLMPRRIVKSIAKRVYYEAALGMQDNFAFH